MFLYVIFIASWSHQLFDILIFKTNITMRLDVLIARSLLMFFYVVKTKRRLIQNTT
jgi:hypothetical protein